MTNDELVINILENSNYNDISRDLTDFVKTYINKLVSDVAMYVDSSIVVENIQTVDKYTAGQELSQDITGIPSAYSAIDGDPATLARFAESYAKLGIDAEVASTHASGFAPGTAFRTTFTSLRTKEESLHQGGFRTSSSMVSLTATTDFAFVRSKACKRLNPSRNRPNTSTPAERTTRATQTSIKVKPFFISSSIQRLAIGPKRKRAPASSQDPVFQHFQATLRTKDTSDAPFSSRSGTAPHEAPR